MRLRANARVPVFDPPRHKGGGYARPDRKERMRREYLTSCVGKTLEVIFETESDGESRGHAENYTEVAVPGDMPHGVVRKVKITGVRGEMLVGTAL